MAGLAGLVGAGQEGLAWMGGQGLSRMGGRARQGWRGWGTCVLVYKNVCMNRVEYSFGAVCLGKKLEFFTGFPLEQRGTLLSFGSARFFPTEKSGKIDKRTGYIAGKFRRNRPCSSNASLLQCYIHTNNTQ